jgi:acetolactate synthase-1/2/3 large subunit
MGYVEAVKRARNEADLVLVLGSRLGETDWWGKAPYWAPPERQELIQVDLDLEHLANNRPVALLVQADVGAFLDALIALHDGQAPEARLAWAKSLRKDCSKRRAKLNKHLSKSMVPMHPAHVAHTCDKVFPDDAILVIDGGNTAIWANFFHEVRSPNTVLTTPKMGMLGAGVSQAIAAKVARPDKEVYCIIGDGAMGFHQQEIETAVRAGLQVTWLVLCDKQWGMVKINQQFALKPVKTLILGGLSPEETVNTEIGETRFDDLARAMGAHGERVADANGLEGAIRRCRASARPAVIHVDVDPKAHLWAPELRTFKAMHQEPAG